MPKLPDVSDYRRLVKLDLLFLLGFKNITELRNAKYERVLIRYYCFSVLTFLVLILDQSLSINRKMLFILVHMILTTLLWFKRPKMTSNLTQLFWKCILKYRSTQNCCPINLSLPPLGLFFYPTLMENKWHNDIRDNLGFCNRLWRNLRWP